MANTTGQQLLSGRSSLRPEYDQARLSSLPLAGEGGSLAEGPQDWQHLTPSPSIQHQSHSHASFSSTHGFAQLHQQYLMVSQGQPHESREGGHQQQHGGGSKGGAGSSSNNLFGKGSLVRRIANSMQAGKKGAARLDRRSGSMGGRSNAR